MIKLRMSIYSESWVQGYPSFSPTDHQVIWVQFGTLMVNGKTIHPGHGIYVNNQSHIDYPATAAPQVIRFELTTNTHQSPVSTNSKLLLSNTFTVNDKDSILRLDRVTFPASATAYRHTHSGAGIRYLLSGQLHVAADDHTQVIEQGQAWFEDAYSPVKATSGSEGITEFIRVMVLPNEFLGKPTIKRLNPEDSAKPTLQTNTRYFDLALNFA